MLKGNGGERKGEEGRNDGDCNYISHGCFACLMEFCSYQMNQLWTRTKLIWSRWRIKGTEIYDEVLMLLNYFQDFFNKICDDKSPCHDVKHPHHELKRIWRPRYRVEHLVCRQCQDHLVPEPQEGQTCRTLILWDHREGARLSSSEP